MLFVTAVYWKNIWADIEVVIVASMSMGAEKVRLTNDRFPVTGFQVYRLVCWPIENIG